MKDETIDDLLARKKTQFEELVDSFPCLKGADGTRPWDVETFVCWLCDGRSHGEKVSGRFVLGVWSPTQDWVEFAKDIGSHGAWLAHFDLFEAISCWDDKNKAAFIAWCSDPFYP